MKWILSRAKRFQAALQLMEQLFNQETKPVMAAKV